MKRKHSTKRALIASVVSLCLCFSMLIGTTYAWFTDSVTSSGNIIKSGTLDIEMRWADGDEDPATATWTDAASGPIFNYENWEPGYAAARHLEISNVGSLAFNYKMTIVADGTVSKLADVIDVYYFDTSKAFVRDDIANATYLGTLTQVLGTNDNLSKTIRGSIEPNASADDYTIVLKMQESAGNEYQGMDLGCTFSIKLLASQMAYEEDSFDENYDDNTKVPDESIPAALVRPIDDLNINYRLGLNGSTESGTLDTGYKFEPTSSLTEAQSSMYRYWHADFVVYTDSSVPANSMALAGYYNEWCKAIGGDWIALTADVDIDANTEIRLVETLGATVNWEEICKYGNDGLGFQCGAMDLTGVNAGTTLTVELRLYETTKAWDAEDGTANTETGNYIIVNSFKYTFESKTTDTSVITVGSAAELQAALDNAAAGTTYINFVDDIAGDVTVSQKAGVNLVINGCSYKYDGSIQINGNSNIGSETLVIKNVNFETANATSASGHDAFIWSCDSNAPVRYAHNVNVENCSFTAVAGSLAEKAFVGVKVQQAYNIAVINSTATNMHSLMQAESCATEVSVDGCKVINCKSGVSFNNTLNAVITNTEIESVVDGGYGIRHKGQVNNYSLTVENCTIKAFVPVLIRNMTGNGYTATFDGENDFTATNDFGYEVVVSAGDWDNDASAPTAPTGSYTLVGANGFSKNVG